MAEFAGFSDAFWESQAGSKRVRFEPLHHVSDSHVKAHRHLRRTSTADHQTTASQIRELRAVAERHGWTVAGVFDGPRRFGGEAAGPGPYDYLLAALGACTSMTMRLYAERKGINAERFATRLSHRRIHSEDCVDCDTTARV